jgi:hypothetical protein
MEEHMSGNPRDSGDSASDRKMDKGKPLPTDEMQAEQTQETQENNEAWNAESTNRDRMVDTTSPGWAALTMVTFPFRIRGMCSVKIIASARGGR